jgi:hypothetical protein
MADFWKLRNDLDDLARVINQDMNEQTTHRLILARMLELTKLVSKIVDETSSATDPRLYGGH